MYKESCGPDWCGSVDWALDCEPKGCQFDSRAWVAGQVPLPRPRSRELSRGNHTLMFLSLSSPL